MTPDYWPDTPPEIEAYPNSLFYWRLACLELHRRGTLNLAMAPALTMLAVNCEFRERLVEQYTQVDPNADPLEMKRRRAFVLFQTEIETALEMLGLPANFTHVRPKIQHAVDS